MNPYIYHHQVNPEKYVLFLYVDGGDPEGRNNRKEKYVVQYLLGELTHTEAKKPMIFYYCAGQQGKTMMKFSPSPKVKSQGGYQGQSIVQDVKDPENSELHKDGQGRMMWKTAVHPTCSHGLDTTDSLGSHYTSLCLFSYCFLV